MSNEAAVHPHVLLRGKHQGFDNKLGARRLFQKGDVVFLTKEQAHAFRDKFKSVEVVEAESRVAAAHAETAARLANDMKSPASGAPASTPTDNTDASAASGSNAPDAAGVGASAKAAPQSKAGQGQTFPASAPKTS